MFELKSIYGLTNEVISNINKTFDIKQPRNIKKINLNIATQEDLVQVPYIDYELAYSIIEMRVLKEGFKTVDELTKLKDFPTNKLDIIKLYLHIK
jgi:DNA uptake protein ComE-like DNA-binding protein